MPAGRQTKQLYARGVSSTSCVTHYWIPPASRYAQAIFAGADLFRKLESAPVQGDGRRCQVITGPNMGGKSCYTR